MGASTQFLTLGALFMALGVLIPIIFHALGLGPIFLPMFWPIAVSGFYLPVVPAMIVGCLTPILSMLLTGMPPPPILYRMVWELAILGGCTACLYRNTRTGLMWPLVGGLIIAQIMGLLGAAAIAPLLGWPPEMYALATFLEGIPGSVTILICVPWLLHRLKNESIWRRRDVGKGLQNIF